MTEYRCMSADELATWTEGADLFIRMAGAGPRKPCWDCPMSFRAVEFAAGRCDIPARKSTGPDKRAYKREWMRASRARTRATCDNGYGSSSAQSHRLPNDARVSATTRGAGVVAPIEVVAR